MSSVIKKSMIAGGSFAGGIIAGYLLSSRKEQLSSFMNSAVQQTKMWTQSVDKERVRVFRKGREKVAAIGSEFKRSFRDPIPDLYRATESMTEGDLDLKLPR